MGEARSTPAGTSKRDLSTLHNHDVIRGTLGAGISLASEACKVPPPLVMETGQDHTLQRGGFGNVEKSVQTEVIHKVTPRIIQNSGVCWSPRRQSLQSWPPRRVTAVVLAGEGT